MSRTRTSAAAVCFGVSSTARWYSTPCSATRTTHLKNFALRREPVGWRLTPAFDLLPDVTQRGEHCLHFGPAGHRPGREALRTLAGAFGVSRQRAALILDEVSAAVAGWRARFDEYGVPSADSERLGRDIERRLATRA